MRTTSQYKIKVTSNLQEVGNGLGIKNGSLI
jgi:hypothetical protein